jgi:hypothetical protein
MVIVVLIALEVRQQRREARAIESLEHQWFQVNRSSEDDGLQGWLRDNLLAPLNMETMLAGPVTRVWDIGSSEPARPDDLSPLLEFPELRAFIMMHDESSGRAERINDRLLAPLASLNQLRSVDIAGSSSLTDQFLAGLADCSDLERLGVSSSHITDAGLRHLSGCRKLESMYLAGCRIHRGLESLSLEHVTSLYLNDTEVDDEGVKCLARARKLEELQLSRTMVGDRCLRILQDLPELRVVWMHKTQITDDGLRDFQPASKEIFLVLPDTKATLEEAIRVTTERPNLTVAVGKQDDFFIVEAGKARPSGSKSRSNESDSKTDADEATE